MIRLAKGKVVRNTALDIGVILVYDLMYISTLDKYSTKGT
jgi:hypothetical protein